MIITETDTAIIVHKCHQCGSINIVRNGTNRIGQEQYHCHDCGVFRVLKPKRTQQNQTKHQVLKACLERCSLRGVARIFKISRNTIISWVKAHVETLPELTETLLPPSDEDVLEWDEAWSFVAKKVEKRWIWTVMCRRTRQIVGYVIGDRSESSCKALWNKLPKAYQRLHSYSDLWKAYQRVIPSQQHEAVGKESGETAHMERWYNTLRQWLGRMSRKTLSFSKKDDYHDLFINWFIIEHNQRMASSLT